MAKKKFDTNPLDPAFPEKAREAQSAAVPKQDYKTAEFTASAPSVTEEETRRFSEADFQSYQQPFDNQQTPVNFASNPFSPVGENSSRNVKSVGMPENIMTALPYLPFSIGLIAGVIELLLVPRSESKVRFHAAQGLAAHLGILIVSSILGIVDNFMPFAAAGNKIFWLVTTIMLIVFAIKSFQGKPVHIEAVEDLTNFLDDKIKPRK